MNAEIVYLPKLSKTILENSRNLRLERHSYIWWLKDLSRRKTMSAEFRVYLSRALLGRALLLVSSFFPIIPVLLY